MDDLVLNFDGGSRNNPGPSGCGALLSANGVVLWEGWRFVDHATNNEAEYGALILGLELLLARRGAAPMRVEVRGDSKLVLNQVTGIYRVRDRKLVPLCLRARALAESLGLPPEAFVHVSRRHNAHADRLANHAMDSRTSGSRDAVEDVSR